MTTTNSNEENISLLITDISYIVNNLSNNDDIENINTNVHNSQNFMMNKDSNLNQDQINPCFNNISNGQMIMNADIFNAFSVQLVPISDQNSKIIYTHK